MNSFFDDIADTAGDLLIITVVFWLIFGALYAAAWLLWRLLLGVLWCLLLLWHGTGAALRYFFRRRADT